MELICICGHREQAHEDWLHKCSECDCPEFTFDDEEHEDMSGATLNGER